VGLVVVVVVGSMNFSNLQNVSEENFFEVVRGGLCDFGMNIDEIGLTCAKNDGSCMNVI
jgi:hypothetical protein